MGQLGSHEKDLREIWYLSIFREFVQKFKVSQNQTRLKGTLHEDQYTFLIVSRLFLLRLRNVTDKF